MRYIRINRTGDVIRLNNNFIFLNVGPKEVRLFNSVSLKREVRVHVFVTSNDDIRSGNLDDLIMIFRDNNSHPRSKFVIHVPWDVRSIMPKLYKEHECTQTKPFKVVMERNGLFFRIPNTDCILKIDYVDNKIVTSIPIYDKEIIEKRDPHNVSEDIKKHKEEYKEFYLEFFKATTPLGILKTFKDEDDIWDYIMMQNGWAPTKEEMNNINNRKPIDTPVIKPVTITTMEKDPEKVKAMMEEIMRNAAEQLAKDINGESE